MLEVKLISEFPQEIIAVDEVGRGPLCGPVVIGAIQIIVNDVQNLKRCLKLLKPLGVTDSKKLSTQKRKSILDRLGIKDLPFKEVGKIILDGLTIKYVTWDMDHEIIDEENILAASLRGMKEASFFLSEKKNSCTTVLIDGPKKLRWGKEDSPWNEIPIIKGDSKSLLIGLASIIAKEKRDAFMKEMHELYPQYGFNLHFGYPTESHRKAIKQYGPCFIHRKTFKGVKEYVGIT
jgi:ribonuclease HII